MRKAKWFLLSGGLAVILLSVLMVSSCSDNKILTNAGSDQQMIRDLAAIHAADLARAQLTANPGLAKLEGDSYLIAQTQYGFEISGSALTTSFALDHTTITIQVPSNAFDKTKWGDRLYIFIRAEKWGTPYGTVSYYECTPSGVVFNSPLRLIQPYVNRVAGKQNLYLNNVTLNSWVTEDTQSVINGSVKFNIGHFSKYAISD